ncbi:OmpA family protein [Cupriavidus plantarum]|uniref:OmpA family protein n=1 Tax=Cupriavidus plantarum TaxID=942865 RepID=UPI001B1B72F5|nr:OmpA family protein [Cupriavidus plantarum]CAG2144842.1 Peptidoglycan-associated lipoprotein [Cupriavidus plantarum]SMR85975.1 Outer membrane protein OmpA [Cupriavidus plantarum]
MSYRSSFQLRRALLLTTAGLAALALTGCATPESRARLTPAQVALLQSEGFKLTDNGWELGISDKVLFGVNEDTITPERQAPLLRLGRLLSEAGISDLRVNGHTDDTGSVEYNQQLSIRRATAVARTLESAGFSQGEIKVRGLGKTMPIADNRTAAGRAENRRVAIIVTVD